jgi:hypothetical protein
VWIANLSCCIAATSTSRHQLNGDVHFDSALVSTVFKADKFHSIRIHPTHNENIC